ncbi:TPA: EAL domain-containing response regulator [Pseudomonas aeruginosa]|uniref:EAL domain-containing response regulator n=1 Tax=Pseudomonas aeruginosa TaxID=287 RepID=UPI0025B45BAE|nr:EAL domain-containing response regulator [Pseudomonas aeruginosa]MCO2439079.1 EAL domain-containing response regulator [Pseudomonas aeruginosa]MDN3852923.1 EAL domain-containing response regulator [Pseudomonas aeruginosa]MDY1462733.1 EAL domain-containing response regulator [Pseudomonas aeruginosa]HBO5669964.1 EAL domain-containing response regulator [Pseudomonas aeruginosa]HBP1972613.1 EAL domain-containing response regulator [Pseudomonas aeruginosa]
MQVLPLRVLVLEDHLFQQAVAVSMLRQIGCHEVFSASNGTQALEVLQRVGSVDIALCDLNMEGMDGLEFLHRVARAGLVGAVILSSSLSEDVRRAARKLVPLLGMTLLGDAGKPLQADALKALLKKYLDEPAVTATNIKTLALAEVDEVRSAMQHQQMGTYFQPKINLLRGDVVGVEALTRWNHPSGGVISPAVFMPTIESCGLLNELFFTQLKHGLELQRQALNRGFLLNIAFNLEPVQLTNPDLVSTIKSVLGGYGLHGSSLTLELTESGLLEVSATCLESLVRLRMMGCRLSIDDFGVGFSSLQRLCQLPFNEIKLDAEFVRGLGNEPEPRCLAVISSTLALGKALGMSVVVEGIEKQEQYQQLLELGCTEGQGYLFAKPMNHKDLLGWLDTWAVPGINN